MEELRKELELAKSKGLFRELKTLGSSSGRDIEFGGRKYINFSSNNYLDLAGHPAVIAAAKKALDKYGAGGTSSRLIAGTLDIHSELEKKLASFKHCESSLVFPSGYQTNLGVISALAKEGDCVIMDKLNHASLWDGAKLSGARIFVYPHRDIAALEKVLKRAKAYRRKLVVTDSVFSMDGDLAPLKEISELSKQYGAWTFVDEAHATGVFGDKGSGLVEHSGAGKDIDIVMGTLSKALGSQGGFVCGKKLLIDYIVNFCRSFIYTTSLAPASCAAAIAALEIVEIEPERRKKLLLTASHLKKSLKGKGFDTGSSESQIIPLIAGSVERAAEISKKLLAEGIFAPAIRPPTVPENMSRIRFSLTAAHNEQDVARILKAL